MCLYSYKMFTCISLKEREPLFFMCCLTGLCQITPVCFFDMFWLVLSNSAWRESLLSAFLLCLCAGLKHSVMLTVSLILSFNPTPYVLMPVRHVWFVPVVQRKKKHPCFLECLSLHSVNLWINSTCENDPLTLTHWLFNKLRLSWSLFLLTHVLGVKQEVIIRKFIWTTDSAQ